MDQKQWKKLLHENTLNELTAKPQNDPWGARDEVRNRLQSVVDEFNRLSFNESDMFYNENKDIRFELISSLLSIAIQFSIDIEMEKEELIEMIGAIYEEEEEITREENEEIDNSKLN